MQEEKTTDLTNDTKLQKLIEGIKKYFIAKEEKGRKKARKVHIILKMPMTQLHLKF
jgi:hypothetical protein